MALTRSQFFVMIQRYATGFQFHGIQPGDHICAHLSNSVENFVTLIGCLFAGATVVLAKTSLTPRTYLRKTSSGTGMPYRKKTRRRKGKKVRDVVQEGVEGQGSNK